MTKPDEPLMCLVTGGNKGIGLATVRRLVAAGHQVYLGSRDLGRGSAAAEGVGARSVQLDVTSDESVRAAAELVGEDSGRLDVLINNAGITGPVRDVHEYDATDAAAVLMTNVVGYVRMIHAFLPLLELARDPRIVFFTSGLGSFTLAYDLSGIESPAGLPELPDPGPQQYCLLRRGTPSCRMTTPRSRSYTKKLSPV